MRAIEQDPEKTVCPYHGGHDMLTLAFDEENYDKVVFDAHEKEKKVHSLQGKVDSAGGHAKHKRPWGALGTMMSRANMRSETKTAMAQIGISLHGVKSKPLLSVRLQAMPRHVVPCCRGSRSS